MENRRLNKKGKINLLLMALILTILILTLSKPDSKYFGFYGLALVAFLPVFWTSFKSVVNNTKCIPGMLKVYKENHSSKQEKVDKLLDYMESKRFSFLAPFVCIIVDVLFIWFIIFLKRYIYDSSYFILKEWTIQNPPISIQIIYYAVVILLLVSALLIPSKSKKIISLISLVSSVVIVCIQLKNSNGLLMYISILSFLIADTWKNFFSEESYENPDDRYKEFEEATQKMLAEMQRQDNSITPENTEDKEVRNQSKSPSNLEKNEESPKE